MRMCFKKVHNLFGGNLFAEGRFNAVFGQDIEAHIFEFPLWFCKLFEDFFVQLAFCVFFRVMVCEDPEIGLNNNRKMFVVLFLNLTGISALR